MATQLALPFSAVNRSVNNQRMTQGQGDDAAKKEAAKKLRNKALRLLTTREHSREELLRKLAQARTRYARKAAEEKAAPPDKDDIERVIDDLTSQGWQSDDRYAEAIVRRLTGQAAKRFIADKLAQAGIKKDTAQTALDALEQDEMETATALWQRRFGDAPKDEKERQRQIRYLLSRGFGLGDAFKIVPKSTDPPSSSFGRRWRGKTERDDR
jgi:regulatory protein